MLLRKFTGFTIMDGLKHTYKICDEFEESSVMRILLIIKKDLYSTNSRNMFILISQLHESQRKMKIVHLIHQSFYRYFSGLYEIKNWLKKFDIWV